MRFHFAWAALSSLMLASAMPPVAAQSEKKANAQAQPQSPKTPSPPTAEEHAAEVEKKLAYVASRAPERVYYCRVMPRGSGTSETQMKIDFTLDGPGPVEARLEVAGFVGGRRYTASMRFMGTARQSSENPSEAIIHLDRVDQFVAEPLPGGASWSDPTGDIISLTVRNYTSLGIQPYVLVGTQTSEFGINDLRCLDGERI